MANAQDTPNRLPILPKSYKWITAIASIVIPAFLIFLVFYSLVFKDFEVPFAPLIGFIGYVALVYALAGGFVWEKKKWSKTTYIVLFFLTVIVYAIPLFALWYLIRFILSVVYGIPWDSVKGTLLSQWGRSKVGENMEPASSNKVSDLIVKVVLGAVGFIAVIGLLIGFVNIFPENLRFIPSIILYVGIFVLVIWGLSQIWTFSMMYYCNRCGNVVLMKEVTARDKDIIPEELEKETVCVFCHENLEVKMIPYQRALRAGLIKNCSKCGAPLSLIAKAGDHCPACGVEFSGTKTTFDG
jgi:predicted RNA-binding Zn-ribbon protein involved in translation (DUF1610 family)